MPPKNPIQKKKKRAVLSDAIRKEISLFWVKAPLGTRHEDIANHFNEKYPGLGIDTADQATQHLVQDIEVYIDVIEEPVPTEGLLEDDEIIGDMIENGVPLYSDEEDEEPPQPLISVTEASNALKTLITFYEQAENAVFSRDEATMLRKKVSIFEVMKIKTRKQTSLNAWRI